LAAYLQQTRHNGGAAGGVGYRDLSNPKACCRGMLIASNPLLEGRSFFYEREVTKTHLRLHFVPGRFVSRTRGADPSPEDASRLFRGLSESRQRILFGRRVVRSIEFRDEAPLFRRLSDRFEVCVFGLNLVKHDLDRQQNAAYAQVRRILG
jgi:hypothetical protein